MLNEIKYAFPNAKLSAKMGEYLSVITALIPEFSKRFQDYSVIDKEITMFAAPFSFF